MLSHVGKLIYFELHVQEEEKREKEKEKRKKDRAARPRPALPQGVNLDAVRPARHSVRVVIQACCLLRNVSESQLLAVCLVHVALHAVFSIVCICEWQNAK